MFVACGYRGLLCPSVLTAVSITVSAQAPATPPMPKDPNQLLLLVQKQNRLTSPDIQPWHLKISVKQFDPFDAGIVESQIEEFWAGESKHKIIYTTPTATLTEYSTEKGLFRSAGSPLPPGPLMQAGSAFTNPIFESESLIEKWILKRGERKENGVKVVCLSTKGINAESEKHEFVGSTYCFDAAQASLLSISNPIGAAGDAVYTRNNIQDFHGYYLPREMELTAGGKRILEAQVDLLEDLAQADDALFSPPPQCRTWADS